MRADVAGGPHCGRARIDHPGALKPSPSSLVVGFCRCYQVRTIAERAEGVAGPWGTATGLVARPASRRSLVFLAAAGLFWRVLFPI
jgi:hypothetical protein